jgi:predicted membrane-bound spermidine synthase
LFELDISWKLMSLSTAFDDTLALDRASRRPLSRPLIYGLFLVSGSTALVYQTAWQRLLGLFSGSDTVAATIVVGAFLLGLGLGSLAGAWLADRLSRRAALRAFAWCELLIGLFAALSPLLFYDVLFGRLIGYAGRADLVMVFTFLALLPPTLMMGLSLPLLSRAMAERIETVAVDVGLLYGVNTLGACLGAFLAGWVILGTIGYTATIYLAAALNALVALGAARAQRDMPAGPSFLPKAAWPAAAAPGSGARVWYWSGLVFLSGFLIIALEIVWFRLLGVLMQSNAYAFSLVLAVFLLGDALGMVAGAAVVRHIRDLRRAFLLLQGGMACFALVSALALHVTHGAWPGFITPDESGLLTTLPSLLAVMALTAFVVLPPAFLLGMSFPVAQRAVQDDPGLVGQRVGLIQLFNILGNAVGALVAGLLLIHWLGTLGTLRLVAVAGMILLVPTLRDWLRGRRRWAEAGLGLATLAAFVALPGNAAFWARLHGATSAEAVAGSIVAEDRTGLAVLRGWGGGMHSLYIAGHIQSGLPFGSYHVMLGLIGVTVHPEPKSVLIIGQGTGGTPYGAGARPETEKIRVMEIVGPVVELVEEAARRELDKGVVRYMADPRFERVIGDARHALFIENESYDVIEADAIYPHSSRAGMLYSVEHFRQVLARLKPGGIYVQWQPTPRTERTFRAVFPHIVQVGAVLLGSNAPIRFDLAAVAKRVRGPMRPYLEAAGIDPERIVTDLGGPVATHEPSEDRPSRRLNTDLFPRDEYYLNSPVSAW